MAKKTKETKAPPVYRKRVKATEGIVFEITTEDIACAIPKDPENCVVAKAIRRAIGQLFETVIVGSTVTKVITDSTITSFTTSHALSRALKTFDDTDGCWTLKPGKYALEPYDLSRNRLPELRRRALANGKGKRTEHTAIGIVRACRTRIVQRVDTLVSV